MLTDLRIKNFVLIDEIDLTFHPGFTVLTGETGAGKSILVQALGLLRGGRSSQDWIRAGEEEAVVEAIFAREGDELCVRRAFRRDGRNHVTINGALATVAMLRETLAARLTIAGQHEHQALMSAATHVEWLDRFARADGPRAAVAVAFERDEKALSEVERIRQLALSREERGAWLSYRVEEIEQARLRPGEDADLSERRAIVRHGAQIAEVVAKADERLYSGDGAVLTALHAVKEEIARLGGVDPRFAAWAQGIGAAMDELGDVAQEIQRYAGRLDIDPAALDEIEQRLDTIERLKRKYGGSIESVIEAGQKAREELREIEDFDAALARAVASQAEARQALDEACRSLSRVRRRGAKSLARAVVASLREIGMNGARFSIVVEPASVPGRLGADRVEFLFGANAGEPVGQLASVASGGELSRIALALRDAVAEGVPVDCTLYDEIDAGVGGAAADAVGQKLKAVAARGQVIAVTHLAPIAALADHHLVVTKVEEGGRTMTRVTTLPEATRPIEVARMLAGRDVTERALAHAREMMKLRSPKESRVGR